MGLFDLFSNDSAEDAARAANAGLQAGYAKLTDLYGQGRGALEAGAGKAAGVYTGLMDQYAPGAAAYGDVSGAHGVEGLQRGTDLFKNSGQYGVYGFANDQAQQALQRAGAAAGRLDSGNTNYGAMDTASKLAGQHWGQFQQGLQPYLGAYGTAGQGLANVHTGLGTGLNASFMGQGNAANQMETGMGKNIAGAELNEYQVGANTLGAIMGGLNWMSGGGPANLAKGASSLFSGFGAGAK